MTKSLARYMLLLAILLSMTACAGPKPTEIDVAIEMSKVQEKSSCVRARAEADKAKYESLSNLQDPRDIALISMADALKEVAGKDKKDPCDMGMNFHESRSEIAKSQNQTIDSFGGKLMSGTIATVAALETGKTLRTAIENVGSKSNTTITGDGNKVEAKNEDTRTNTTTTNTAKGDNSPASTTNTSTATGQSPTTTSSPPTSGTTSELSSAIASCEPASHTQGQVAVCLSQAGYEVNIEHGITYVDGSPLSGITYAPPAGEVAK